MYKVRTATVNDTDAFSPLLASLGYPSDPSTLRTRIPIILKNPDAILLVATSESSDTALGLLSMHFIPQLGLNGDVARLGFFVVDENCHGGGIGKSLESHAEKLARERGCDRMVIRRLRGSADLQEVHCHERRAVAHNFYARQGYRESPKYFVKLFGEETDAEKEWNRKIAVQK